MGSNPALGTRLTGEDLTEDEVELLRSREPTEEDYGRVKYRSAKRGSGAETLPSPQGDKSNQDLVRDDAPRPGRAPQSGEKERLNFCEFLGVGITRELIEANQNTDMGACIKMAVWSLMMGVAFARKYPSKARAVLVREEEPLPLSVLDRIGWKMRNGPLADLWLGEEELLKLHQSEWSRYLQKADQENDGYGWLLGKVFARLEPELSEKDSNDQTDLLTALVWAIRDGIAFGLFVTNDRALKEFYQEAGQTAGPDSREKTAAVVEQILEAYEAHSGTIDGL